MCLTQVFIFHFFRTWEECLKTTKKSSKSTKLAKSTKSEQKDKNSKTTNHSDKPNARKTKSKPRPKFDKRAQSLLTTPWSYNPQMMYNQQVPGNYGVPPPQPLPSYMYGHPQMMPHDGVYRGPHNASTMRTSLGASANVQYMLGRGFDPRLYVGQMHQTNELNKRGRSKSQPDLDYLIFEENEDRKEESEEEGEEPSYVPSTPANSTPRTRIHSNEKIPARRSRRDGHRSPLRDEPVSPVFDDPPSSPIDDVMLNSLGNENKPLERTQSPNGSKLAGSRSHTPVPQKDTLSRRKASVSSLSPDRSGSAPVLLTDVWNENTPPGEIDKYMERRRSVQDNRYAVLQSLKEMEDRMVKKTSITSSIKNMFRRRK